MSESEPSSKEQIVEALARLGDEGMRFWSDFQPGQFVAAVGSGWSPAENVLHLIKATKPVTLALRLPRFVPRLLFGVADAPSAPYAEVRNRYKAVLRNGGQAGRFSPAKVPASQTPEHVQATLMRQIRKEIAALGSAVERWGDADLDRYRLPHPLLGKLAVREMLLFTLIHYEHHRQSVATRMQASV